ncbi:BTAD domain-containing putative transcriptional regulator [Actinokineospora bangkokensis]|uniref:OmpR/PhoB-type domain-containing protein n=1 Tax=Actinokineospora bangkokensis TaxID=1193682 RepID=A0A1Q9LK31_9PSEU|nr:BTAD domain-containing putative transcriptional regulator [Actinokineospora bangkokensis]OLR92388.1 hypothetical protein BJP25_20080 [Actinokineospora bangkokensis]
MIVPAAPARTTGLLRRDDLVAKVEAAAAARVRVVVGPPGSGKTVLLRLLAGQPGGADVVRGCALDAAAGTEAGLVAAVAAAFGLRVPGEVDALCEALDSPLALAGPRTPLSGGPGARVPVAVSRVVLHVDDAHVLVGTPGGAALTRLVAQAPPGMRFVLAGRDDRVADLVRPGPRFDQADLRLRTWEVEELFARSHRAPLDPETAAALCARAEGLVGPVRLLHLDTARLPPAERAAALAAPLAHSPRLERFLDREVLGPLPAPLREFVLAAAPLGVLDGALCDVALDRADSHAVLTELTARNALTTRVPGGRLHRFHVLLQQHAEQRMAERGGPHLTRRAYRTAAAHLADAGHWAAAHRCHSRAGDWVAAAAVLHRFGAHPGALRAGSALPDVLLADDPWVALADARRLRAEGRLAEAHDTYARAEALLPDPRLRWRCSLERSAVARWLGHPGDPLVDDVCGRVADALRERPAKLLTTAVPTQSPGWTLGRAVAALLDGRPDRAVELASELPDGAGFVPLAGRVVVAVVHAVTARTGPVGRFARLAAECEAAGWLWLARLCRAAPAVLDPDHCADAAAVVDECVEVDDPWGAVLAGWLLSVGLVRAGRDPVAAVEAAIARADALGARVPAAWQRLLRAEALREQGDERAEAAAAELGAELAGTALDRAAALRGRFLDGLRAPAPRPVLVAADPAVEAAATVVLPTAADEHVDARVRTALAPPPGAALPAEAHVQIRCFGRYALTVDGVPVPLDGLRTHPRRLLHMLSIHCGQPLHDERLMTALWPDAPVKRAKHRLQVAISTLRAHLRGHLPPDHGVVRQGTAYLLRLPGTGGVDLVAFESTARRWRTAHRQGDHREAIALGRAALELYRGELLTEEGPAEWLLARREALRGEAAAIAAAVATAELTRGDPEAAIATCERGITIDELDHRLWALLAEARSRTGNHAAALRTRRAYQDLLAQA